MNHKKLVICDLDHEDLAEETKVLSAAGYDFDWLHCKTQEEVIEQCQGAVVFLASAASDYLSGAVIPVDGGYLGR